MRLVELLTTSRAQTTHISADTNMASGGADSSTAKTSPFPFSLSGPLSTLSKLLMLDKTSMFGQPSNQSNPSNSPSNSASGCSRGVGMTDRNRAATHTTTHKAKQTPVHTSASRYDSRVNSRCTSSGMISSGTMCQPNSRVTYGTKLGQTGEAKSTHIGDTVNIPVPTSANYSEQLPWIDIDDVLTFRDLASSGQAGADQSALGQAPGTSTLGDDSHRRQRFSSVMSNGSSDDSSDLLNLNYFNPERRGYSASVTSSPTSDDWASGTDGIGASVPWRELNIDPLATIWPSLQLDESDQYGIENLPLFNFNDVGSQFDSSMDTVLMRDLITPVGSSGNSEYLLFSRSPVNSVSASTTSVDMSPGAYHVEQPQSPVNTGTFLNLARSPVIGSPDTTTSEIMKLLLKSKLSPTSNPTQSPFTESLQTGYQATNLGGLYKEVSDLGSQNNFYASQQQQQQQQPIYTDSNHRSDTSCQQNSRKKSSTSVMEQLLTSSIDLSSPNYLPYLHGQNPDSTADTNSIFDNGGRKNSVGLLSGDELLQCGSSGTACSATNLTSSYNGAGLGVNPIQQTQTVRSDNITGSKLYELIVSNRTQDANKTKEKSAAVGRCSESKNTSSGVSESQHIDLESESIALKQLEERLKRQWKGMQIKRKLIEELKGEKFQGSSAEYLRRLFCSTLTSQSDLDPSDIKREMEEIFPGTLPDHDYCQNSAQKPVSSTETGHSGNKGKGCSSRSSENSTLRNLLLDGNLADEVKRQAMEDREKSRRRMSQTNHSCLNIPNPLLKCMATGEDTVSCCSPNPEDCCCITETNNNDLVKEEPNQNLVISAELKDLLDWPELLGNLQVEIANSNQVDQYISIDGDFSGISNAGDNNISSPSYIQTTSESIVYSSPGEVEYLETGDLMENQDIYRESENILDFNMLSGYDYADISDCVIEKDSNSETGACGDSSSASAHSTLPQGTGSKTKRTSRELSGNDSSKSYKRQPTVKRLATVTAVNKNKSLNKVYTQSCSARYMNGSNKL